MGQRDRFLFYLASSVLEYRQNNYVKQRSLRIWRRSSILAVFHGDIRDLRWKRGAGKQDFQLLVGAGFRVFIGLGSRLARETERDTGFQFQRDFIISWPTQNRKRVSPLQLCVSLCLNGSVPCQDLSSVSIIAYSSLVSDCMRSLGLIVIFWVDLWRKRHSPSCCICIWRIYTFDFSVFSVPIFSSFFSSLSTFYLR